MVWNAGAAKSRRGNLWAAPAVLSGVVDPLSRRYVETPMSRITRACAPFALVLGLCCVALPAAATDPTFRCDGTNQAFFEEVNAAGWTGFGETWDWYTYCVTPDSRDVFMSGATRRWRKMRPQWSMCPSCSSKTPVYLDDPLEAGGLFCPACGTLCSLALDRVGANGAPAAG